MKNELQKRILSSLVLIPLALFFIVKGSLLFNFFTLLCFIVTSYEWHTISKKKSYFFPGFIFIIFSFYTFFFFRNEIYMTFLLILLTCVSTDIGGYVFGKILKGPGLTKISPNKTYSGMFGGFLLALVSSNIYLNNLKLLLIGDNIKMEIELFITVLLISFVSQIGDITISFFKRKSKIKNTGNIIPGHGGLLDRIDGMIFAFPFVYIIIKIIP